MLKLRYETEDWREALTGVISELDVSLDDISMFDDCADDLCRLTLEALDDAGVEYERAHQQSRGAFVIVQAGTDEEIEAFDKAMESAKADIREFVIRTAKSLEPSE